MTRPVDGQICSLPNGVGSLFKTMAPFKKPHFVTGIQEVFAPPKYCEDCSAYELMERRFGRDYAEYLIDPMTRGICAGDAREISAEAFVLGPVFRREQVWTLTHFYFPTRELPGVALVNCAVSHIFTII